MLLRNAFNSKKLDFSKILFFFDSCLSLGDVLSFSSKSKISENFWNLDSWNENIQNNPISHWAKYFWIIENIS